jgi:hypothetical protein
MILYQKIKRQVEKVQVLLKCNARMPYVIVVHRVFYQKACNQIADVVQIRRHFPMTNVTKAYHVTDREIRLSIIQIIYQLDNAINCEWITQGVIAGGVLMNL